MSGLTVTLAASARTPDLPPASVRFGGRKGCAAMRLGQRLALHVAPVILRLALGIVFLWAGSSKLLHSDAVSGERAARFANMGVLSLPPGVSSVQPVVPEPEAAPPPVVPPPPGPTPEPGPKPEPEGDPKPASPRPSFDPQAPGARPGTVDPAPPALAALSPAVPSSPPVQAGVASATRRVYDASDFPKPLPVRRLYGLALMLKGASKPNEHGRVLWPAALATDAWAIRLAWVVSLTEFIAGIFLLIGLLTRLSALALAFTMLTALWLTQIGPSLGNPAAMWGILPDPAMGEQAGWNSLSSGWLMLLWQSVLGAAALALSMMGPGGASVDALIFRSGSARTDDERKKRAAPASPARGRPL